MTRSIQIQEMPDHFLVLCMMLSCLAFEELNTSSAQAKSHFHVLFFEHQVLWTREKIVDHPNIAERLIGISVIFALAHRFPFRSAIIPPDDAHPSLAVSEPYRHHAIPNFSETVVPSFSLAVADIFCNHTVRVS